MDPTQPTRAYHFVRYFQPGRTEPEDTAFLGPYQWLARIKVPHMVSEAIGLWRAMAPCGGTTTEAISAFEYNAAVRGSPHRSPDIDQRAAGVLAVLARRARKSVPEAPQCALDWATYGTAAGQPRLGDILCSITEQGATIGLYVGEDRTAYHGLGVIDGDRIGVRRTAKHFLYAARRPLYEGVTHAATGIRLNPDGSLQDG